MNVSKLTAYQLIEEKYSEDLNSKTYLLKHKKSGARVAVIENDDNNKVFYIGFRTPPKDSTGVAHILEHSVLCGSEKYPLKDPFVELAKGSLNTFLNAMTYPDKTVYPVASCNDQDFKNLCDVYLDAVFHPNIYNEKKIFMQEGWHYDLASVDDELKLNGVVYNEMKGAFSSADDVISREIMNSLYPDTAYGVESGGDPEVIPELTYEQFLDFHRSYYHPSNSYIYLYGDCDMEERLAYIDEAYLANYDAIEVESFPGEQKSFSETLFIDKEYPISNDESEDNNTYLSFNAVCGTSLDRELYIAFKIVDYALVDSQGTPLKKALLDAAIGSEIYSTYENGIYQPYYSIVAKNANVADKDKFIQLIENTLKEVVAKGFDKNALEAGLNMLEFKYRESDFGTLPRGLFLGLYTLDSWLYDDTKPFINIESLDIFKVLRERIDSDYYEQLVQKYLIDNPHKSVVMVSPKKGLTAERDNQLKNKLEAYKNSLSDAEKEEIVQNTAKLLEYQETPDSPEKLSCIPLLKRTDLDPKAKPFDNEVKDICGIKTLHHNVFTNGIIYLGLYFDVRNLPERLRPYLNILQYVIGGVDTDNHTYESLGYDLDKVTGGLYMTLSTFPNAFDNDKYKVCFALKMKAFTDNFEPAMNLAEEMLFNSKIKDDKRIKEIVGEVKSRLQSKLISSGHLIAYQRALSYLSKFGTYMESLSGMEYYRFLEKADADFDFIKNDYESNFNELLSYILCKDNLMIDITGGDKEFKAVEKAMPQFIDLLYPAKVDYEVPEINVIKKNEGFTSSAQVNYVAIAGNYLKAGLDYTGALRVLKTILGYEYLWSEVRVKGGAYGAMSSFSRSGDIMFVSYRDPNLRATFDIYKKTADFVAGFNADEDTMTKYIIGTMSDIDIPLTPRIRGERSLSAYMTGISYEMIQKERDEILKATDKDIRELASRIKAIIADEAICVVGNEEKIKTESDLFTTILPLINN